jgi:23S rRNA (cytosine1962-C5)-methyltransferase
MDKTGLKGSPSLRLRVKAAAEAKLRAGHPWLFASSIHQQNREGVIGELGVVYDRHNRFLAVGLFDPSSPMRLRVAHAGKPQSIDRDWWSKRLARALAARQGLFDDQTTGWRCVHGESDGFPGLVLDRYDASLVLKLYTAAWLPRLDEMLGLIQEQLLPARVVLRLSRNIQEVARTQFSCVDGQILFGPPVREPVIFRETGLRFEAEVLRGQKTGFFLDQRENRRTVEGLAKGRQVLNAFSFSGGFSLYAARGGALAVTDLDISAHALAAAERNFALNSGNQAMAACRRKSIQADVFKWLARSSRPEFDLVILDPPSLAKQMAERAGALRAYSNLAALGIQRLHPGGILIACSCSAHVGTQDFFGAVRQSAARSARRIRELRTTGHPPDHPVGFKEAEYLKAIYFEVGSAKARVTARPA